MTTKTTTTTTTTTTNSKVCTQRAASFNLA